MMAVTSIIPMTSILSYERQVLHDRRILLSKLHDHMQPFLWIDDVSPPQSHEEQFQTMRVHYDFSKSDDLIKGCVRWTNVKQKEENHCLYGYKR